MNHNSTDSLSSDQSITNVALKELKKTSRSNQTTPKSKIPSGPIDSKWTKHKMDSALINPANRRKFTVIVVGSGLAGGAAAATLGELGYNVKCFCYQDSPRRAHSIAAQGGINAAKNYQ